MQNRLNKSTRYFSDKQEKQVAKVTNSWQTANSGATRFSKGDVVNRDASILLECKTTITNKESFSIKKEWLEKNKKEAFAMGKDNSVLVFNFGPNTNNYYVLDEAFFISLINKN